jgi:hypothetical protein
MGTQPGQLVCKTLSQKKKKTKNPITKRAGGAAQDVGPEFKPHLVLRRKKKCLYFFTIVLKVCYNLSAQPLIVFNF